MEIKERFYKKLSEEFEKFKKSMLNNTKDDIFENAFEIVVKSYIREYLFENEDFTNEQLEKLVEIDNLIEYIFDCYLENGEYLDFDELCAECVEDVLKSIGVLQEEAE